MVTAAELDRALAAGKAEITRTNARPVRCAVIECRRLCGVGQARRLWIDGHKRGFVCQSCQWNTALTCQYTRWRCLDCGAEGDV